MIFNLTPNKQTLIHCISDLARDKFAARAAGYDSTASFPAEDFEDLFKAGLHAPVVPTKYGGLGLGHDSDIFTLWMMTKELAKVDLSLARCWEGHVNAQVLLVAMANESQKKRWFEGIVERGEKWAAWSGEPQSETPSQKACLGTTVQVVDEGYIIDGTKVFATSAPEAQWAILLVNPAGPGGSRHSNSSPTSVLMLACNLSDPSISLDDSWWQPIGMRGTVSYLVRFQQTFIPKENLIGDPGQYILEEWQTRFTPQYGAAFLGAAYTGGVKSWSIVSAARDLGMEVVATSTCKSTPEDIERIHKLMGPDAKIFDWLTAKELVQTIKDTRADILVAGVGGKYAALKACIPFLDINHERHHPYAGYTGMIEMARELDQALHSPVWEQVRQPAPWLSDEYRIDRIIRNS